MHRLGEADPVGLLAAKHFGIPFVDVSPDMPGVSRCDEILMWLSAHPDAGRYVVIDDETDGLDDLPLFQPSAKTGFTIDLVNSIERYLKGETDDIVRQPAITRLSQNVHNLFKRDKS